MVGCGAGGRESILSLCVVATFSFSPRSGRSHPICAHRRFLGDGRERGPPVPVARRWCLDACDLLPGQRDQLLSQQALDADRQLLSLILEPRQGLLGAVGHI